MCKGRAAHALAAFHAIAGHGDVIGGCSPAEIDLGATDSRRDQAVYITRWRGIGRSRWGDGRSPIGLNFRKAQYPVIDSEFIEHAAERIAVMHVAEGDHMGRSIRLQRLRGRCHQGPIHVHPERVGAVRERHGHVVPVRVRDGTGEDIPRRR